MRVQRTDGSWASVGTVYGIGRNYALHAAELGNEVPEDPVVFLKARASVRGLEGGPLAFPEESFHHEVELVLLVGAEVPHGSDPGWAAVEGVALGLDLTRRQVQDRCKAKGLPWTPAKSFAGAAVVGPVLPLAALGGVSPLRFSLEVNGELRQSGDPSHMVFPVPVLLRYLASLAPLAPGDLVFTGTPAGVGPIRRGDAFRLRLEAPGGAWAWGGLL